MKLNDTLTAERLRELLHYDPETGVFTWLQPPCNNAKLRGQTAGCVSAAGYVHIKVDGGSYKAHRLAWLYMTGAWPICPIDHEDLCKSNNRWRNLRIATAAQNAGNKPRYQNNSTGLKGVSFRRGRWYAQIQARGKKKHLGFFDDPSEAAAAYVRAAQQLFGEFARAA